MFIELSECLSVQNAKTHTEVKALISMSKKRNNANPNLTGLSKSKSDTTIREKVRSAGGSTYSAVVLLLQQGGHVSSDGHLLGQLLVLRADPPPQLLQESQQTGPALGARFKVSPAEKNRP